ncbi:MAG: TonB-dependent receptor [Spirochaetia bacterium]|nr:TonB-dependent receptor [Spirochaetia bacterium]MBR5017865.1 TonB-dependent receptor [Spirochaetia bacterium]
MNKVIIFKEHDQKAKFWGEKREINEEISGLLGLERDGHIRFEGAPKNKDAPKYLGIESTAEHLKAGYYIGATWLKEGELAVVVTPKVEKIDYLEMFSSALCVDSERASTYFSDYYGIEFDKPAIEVDEKFNIITPLILIHYISILLRLTKHGLKKGYVFREKNLRSKVKGHLLLHKQLQKNIVFKREERAYCSFQEYTEDIPENQLLKKALLFAKNMINNSASLKKKQTIYESLKISANRLLAIFQNVSDEIEIHEVKSLKINKLFADYKEAVKIAKIILRRFDYSLQNIKTDKNKTLPFWIDMPRLYELYVYKWLKEKVKDDEVLFQVEGYQGTAVDYVLKRQGIILDAKYKPRYENSNAGIIEDIREISGYARDEKILNKFENSNVDKVPCVILYPREYEEMDLSEQEENDRNDGFFAGQNANNIKRIKPYRSFYKMQIDVPII